MLTQGDAQHLFIAEPDTLTPPELRGVDHFLAIGPNVEPDTGFRRAGAVISTADILRLVTVSGRRNVSLARLAGAQWPLAALGAGTPGALAGLLGQDPTQHWETLCWLADLTGLGGSATADSLLYQTGGDPETLLVLLAYLVESTGPAPDRRLSTWADLEKISVGVEAAVLRGCSTTASRAAFWAAMASASPSTPLTLDALVLAALLSEEDVDWESTIAAGFEELRRQWFAQSDDDGAVSLRSLGVLMDLRRLTERRLAALGRELGGGPARVPADLGFHAWSAYRYALSPHWPEYVRAITDAGVAAGAPEILAVSAEVLVEVAAATTGTTALSDATAELVSVATARFPQASFDLDIPEGARVMADRRIVLTILYELLENALEATGRGGRIVVSARAMGGDVLIDVRDSGPGLSNDIVRAAQAFRPGFSTHGDGRGAGLHVARRIAVTAGGDLELVSRAGGHPVFAGAHFCLVLPRATGASSYLPRK